MHACRRAGVQRGATNVSCCGRAGERLNAMVVTEALLGISELLVTAGEAGVITIRQVHSESPRHVIAASSSTAVRCTTHSSASSACKNVDFCGLNEESRAFLNREICVSNCFKPEA